MRTSDENGNETDDTPVTGRGPGRRAVLRAGAVLGAAGGLLATGAPAQAALANSKRFDLADASTRQVYRTTLRNGVLQSVAWDCKNQHLYWLQRTTAAESGNLWVTKTTPGGVVLGRMTLEGFGHGVSMGVQNVGGAVFLWTEWQSGSNGYGTKVGQFQFVDGRTLTRTSNLVEDRTPLLQVGIINPQPSIDPSTNRLYIRYRTAALPNAQIAAFRLSDVSSRRPTLDDVIARRSLPPRVTGALFQGWTAYGRYVYLLDGSPDDTIWFTSVDMNTPAQAFTQRRSSNAGSSLLGHGREPQGLAIWTTPTGGRPRLTFGLYSNFSGKRQASLYYKDRLV